MKLLNKIFKKRYVSDHIVPGDHVEVTVSSGIYKVIHVYAGTMLLRSQKTGEERLYMQSTYKCTIKH